MVAKEMDPADAGREEKREETAQAAGDAPKKRVGLPTLRGRKGPNSEAGAGNAGGLERAKGSRRAAEKEFNGRILLFESEVRILQDRRRADPCIGVGWAARQAGRDPGSALPGVWEEIYEPEEHDSVPVEDAFRDGRKGIVVNPPATIRNGHGDN